MRRPLATLCLILIAACGRESAGSEGGNTAARVPVGLGTITRDSMVESLALTGRLEARSGGSALLTAPAAGVVRAIHVQVGDRVRRGGLVAELQVPELEADAEQKASIAAQAEREAAREQQLLSDGITSSRQAEEAAANARQASASAAAAHDLVARTRVTSPLAGQVQEVMAQRGERVEAGRTLAQILAPDTLDLAVPVPAPRPGAPSSPNAGRRNAGRRHAGSARPPRCACARRRFAHQRGRGGDPRAQPRPSPASRRDGYQPHPARRATQHA